MIQRWILILVVALIALQSVTAIIDSHQLHQSGQEHLSFEHEHPSDPIGQFVSEELLALNVDSSLYDCHHSCHCHGASNLFVSGGNSGFILSAENEKSFEYQLNLPSITLLPAYRPPIV